MLIKHIPPTADSNIFCKNLSESLAELSDNQIIDIKYNHTTIYPGENIHFYSALIIYRSSDDK